MAWEGVRDEGVAEKVSAHMSFLSRQTSSSVKWAIEGEEEVQTVMMERKEETFEGRGGICILLTGHSLVDDPFTRQDCRGLYIA